MMLFLHLFSCDLIVLVFELILIKSVVIPSLLVFLQQYFLPPEVLSEYCCERVRRYFTRADMEQSLATRRRPHV